MNNKKDHIRAAAEAYGDFVCLEDGYVYFYPGLPRGAMSSCDLRILADILDEKNAEWDAIVCGDAKENSL